MKFLIVLHLKQFLELYFFFIEKLSFMSSCSQSLNFRCLHVNCEAQKR